MLRGWIRMPLQDLLILPLEVLSKITWKLG